MEKMSDIAGFSAAKIYSRDKCLQKSDVAALQDWVAKQPHLPDILESQAILFLQSCYYSNETAKTTIDNYFTLKTICSDMFADRNPSSPTARSTADVTLIAVLPKLDRQGYTTVFFRLMNVHPENFHVNNQVRNFDMTMLLYHQLNGPVSGLNFVLDLKGAVLGHLLRVNIMTLKKFLYYLQEAMPIRLKAIHIFNAMPWIDRLLAMAKPFLKKELLQSIHIHSYSMDTMFPFVPKEILPSDYGGTCESISVLHEKTKKMLLENEAYFRYEENQTVDESKRLGKPKNDGDFFGTQGTFKRLELD